MNDLSMHIAPVHDNTSLIETLQTSGVLVELVEDLEDSSFSIPGKVISLDGEPDITEMFYGNDPMFHEWCLDYFRYCWHGSDVFQESKLEE